MIGFVAFVVFVVILAVIGGVFSKQPIQEMAETVEEQPKDTVKAEDEPDPYASTNWHSGYSELFNEEDSLNSTSADSGMSAEDSVKQVRWYEAQKMEIEREWIRVNAEKASLQQLKMETEVLLHKREDIEKTNIANLAKLFETMKSEEVAAIMENIPDVKVGLILQQMKKQNASQVMAALPSQRAAKITLQMIDLGSTE
jgi:flagellar motility protein MotE (MotC chaperone)